MNMSLYTFTIIIGSGHIGSGWHFNEWVLQGLYDKK